ncbi:MAG TPA: AI-2E family transporter [Nitrospira sp.]|nr:AI-2E family transporter [Nitrospira sp.]
MTRPQPFTVVFFALLLFLLYQIALVFQPFLFPVLWAALLVHATYPLYGRLTVLLGGRDTLSAAVLTVVVLAIVVVPLIIVGVLLVRETRDAEHAIRMWIAGGGLERLPEQISTIPIIGERLRAILSVEGLREVSMEQSVLAGAGFLSQFFVDQMGGLLKNTLLLIADFFIMLLVLFFLYKEGKDWVEGLYELIPMEESHKRKIMARLDLTVRAVIKGMLVTALVQGLLAGLAYAMLQVPFPIVLTALTIILAPVPFGGTALVWVPVVVYLWWSASLWKALVMLAWGAGVVSTVDHFLRPWLIGKDIQMPVLFLVFSVLGGLALYGLIGLFIGPVLVSLFLTALQIYREEYHTGVLAAAEEKTSVP